MRRRLFQAATAAIIIAAGLPTAPDAAAALPDPPTVWPPTLYVHTSYIDPGLAIDDALRSLQIARDEAERQAAVITLRPAEPQPTPILYPTDEMLWRLRQCESTNRYDVNTGNGFYGAVQWLRSTWDAAAARAGRPDLVGIRPDLVAPADQDEVTRWWWNHSDPHGQWPVCSWRV